MTEVILIEDVYKLGKVGQVVTVKAGYARNYLIPQGKALRANKNNLIIFEDRKIELENRAKLLKQSAVELAERLSGQIFVIISQASEKGVLYGAVTAVSVGKILTEAGFAVAKDAVQIVKPIKAVGLYHVSVVLHSEVTCEIILNVASSQEQADRNIEQDDTETASITEDNAENIA